MGRRPIHWLVVALATLFTAGCGLAQGAALEIDTPASPNIVLINTDDQDTASMKYMPLVNEHLVREGITFENSFVSDPLCCPSRATTLTGLYPHNHGIWSVFNGPDGGFEGFRDKGLEQRTVAVWLQNAGYDTALLGKYLNGYDSTHIPIGWSDWYAMMGVEKDHRINANGTIVTYPDSKAQADLLAEHAAGFIEAHAGEPKFLYVAPYAPHSPPDVAERHQGMFANKRAPRTPAYNEEDVSDKPPWIRSLEPLSGPVRREYDALYRQRLRSLQGVDEMVARIVSELEAQNEMDNTYIFYTSDNGYMLGEHRRKGKNNPYEESIRVPLVVRGPGVPAGASRPQIALNNDLAPTISDLAGVQPPEPMDGRSLTPLFSGESPWRDAALIEYRSVTLPRTGERGPWRGYGAVRTANRLYAEYKNGEKELYNLRDDPYQLTNRAGTADSGVLGSLDARLEELKGCASETCREAEGP
jgi:arylsulfatase A-like enzyme